MREYDWIEYDRDKDPAGICEQYLEGQFAEMLMLGV